MTVNDSKRYEHWLYRTGKGSFPKQILCVCVDVLWVRAGGDPLDENATLAQWHATPLVRYGAGYWRCDQRGGTTAAEFWRLVSEYIRGGRSLWILATESREALTVLEVWRGIETGQIQPAGIDTTATATVRNQVPAVRQCGDNDPLGRRKQVGKNHMWKLPRDLDKSRRPARAGKAGAGKRPAPLMILSDPPIVLQMNLAGSRGKITWVDAENYGVQVPGKGYCDSTRSTVLADWFGRAAGVLSTIGNAGWRTTAGSQAMHLYRSCYCDTPTLSHTHRGATALEAASVHGGRNECFKIGAIGGRVYAFDFRSLYPFVCATAQLPCRLVAYGKISPVAALPPLNSPLYTIAEVEIETPLPDYPKRVNDGTIFPVGRFATVIGGPELRHAVMSGHVRGVRRWATYETGLVLATFAREMFSHRSAAIRNGDKMLSSWLKRILVSLPGKFAQRDRRWVTRIGADALHEWGEWFAKLPDLGTCRFRSIGGIVQAQLVGEYVSGAVPAITSAVCAYGRYRLRMAMAACGRENVYYCDTDSIITNEDGRINLIMHGWIRDDELGFMREEVSAESAEIYGIKHYKIGDRLRYAGMPGGGQRYYATGVPEAQSKGIAESMRAKERPEAFRRQTTYTRGPGRYDSVRPAGGMVAPVELMEW